MKIFSIFTFLLVAMAKAQNRKTETALKRVEDTRDAALQWIDEEIPQFRKAKKLRSRINTISAQMLDSIENGCKLSKKKEDDYEEETSEIEKRRFKLPADPWEKTLKFAKSGRRVNKIFLSNCVGYQRIEKKWNRVRNGMQKAFIRVNKLGPDFNP
ncbi:Oidioi.mRNA.OKI2018_I69.chr1.g1648.t1.cds [Oikopleura dioica]|uniref:Oidioi.mRNA.OKI2018_I69.chr1.g1648.t1.cds n=1 Tax=Oikopleura dioica TaxID=34765 RepID=A0ABN7SXQ9_OIKDI|nr:Oidioi.mRNA.OKI2018_I69.chr1.g1648.t1.cds [Oikopleura dioica]